MLFLFLEISICTYRRNNDTSSTLRKQTYSEYLNVLCVVKGGIQYGTGYDALQTISDDVTTPLSSNAAIKHATFCYSP